MTEILAPHLSPGWQQVPLEGVIVRMSNGITKRQTKDGQGFAVSRIETISQGVVDFSRVGYLTDLSPSEVENYRLHAGDILFSHINSDLHLGKTAVVSMNGDPRLHGMNLLLIRVDQEKVLPVFLHWLFNYYRVAGLFMSIAQHAVNQSSINQAKLKNLPVILPALNEQRQIVAEIEKQFTRLEAGVAGLRRVQANLKRYRAAVLKAACEGKLVPTEAELARQSQNEKVAAASRRWSSEQNQRRDASATLEDSYETGAQLLDRILIERREKWSGKGKYQEPEKPDIANLPLLPEGWTWASLDQLQKLLRNGISKKPDAEIGLPILRISAVRALSVNLSDTRYLKAQANDYAEFRLSKGDLLFTRYNGNPDLVGVCGVVPGLSSHLVHPDKLIRCKLASEDLLPKFVGIMANIGASREFLAKRVRTTAGQAGISGGDLKALPIPVAPFAEQQRIVAEVERRLSVVEELEAVVNANVQRATRLRQSILQRAFEGNLSPTWQPRSLH